MSEIVSFRADKEEVALIDATKRRLGLATRADAIRYLLRQAGRKRERFRDSRLAAFRLPASRRTGRTWSSQEIDALLDDDAPAGRKERDE